MTPVDGSSQYGPSQSDSFPQASVVSFSYVHFLDLRLISQQSGTGNQDVDLRISADFDTRSFSLTPRPIPRALPDDDKPTIPNQSHSFPSAQSAVQGAPAMYSTTVPSPAPRPDGHPSSSALGPLVGGSDRSGGTDEYRSSHLLTIGEGVPLMPSLREKGKGRAVSEEVSTTYSSSEVDDRLPHTNPYDSDEAGSVSTCFGIDGAFQVVLISV